MQESDRSELVGGLIGECGCGRERVGGDENVLVCGSFFFFSSRRRHTRLVSDWSSDVCSSDLAVLKAGALLQRGPVKKKAGVLPQRELGSIKSGALPEQEMGSIKSGALPQ